MGEVRRHALRVGFARAIKLVFHGAKVVRNARYHFPWVTSVGSSVTLLVSAASLTWSTCGPISVVAVLHESHV